MRYILALDPGETTGYAYAEIAKGATVPYLASFGTFGGLQGLEDTAKPLLLEADVVVLEDFRIYPHKAQSLIGRRLDPVKTIGQIEYVLWGREVPIYYQMASQAKQLWPNKRLLDKFPSVYRAVTSPHARDAWRHLLTYLETREDMDFFDYRRAL